MSNIELKNKSKIQIKETLICFEDIKKFFKQNIKCNIYNSNINISIGNIGCHPEFILDLECNINKYENLENMLNEFGKTFSTYSIHKDKYKEVIYLRSNIRYSQLSEIKNNSLFLQTDFKPLHWFSLFLNNSEINPEFIRMVLESKVKEDIGEIDFINIENFKNFTFRCANKAYELSYEDFIN